MQLNDNTEWNPTDDDILKWNTLYPAVSVQQELNKMEGWLDANPKKRKTKVGVKRFVNSWLSRAQDQGGSPDLNRKSSKVRQMTALDDLTQNFTNSPEIREHFIQKYGQCYEDGQRWTA